MTILATNNNTLGRLGNQIMRIQSIMGLAEYCGCEWQIPIWPYAKYFETEIPQGPLTGTVLNEPHYHYAPDLLEGKTGNVDLNGYFQSPKYWDELLRFKQSYIEQIEAKYAITDNAIAISIRRGDFLGNKNYFQIHITYYLSALIKHFPDFQHRQIFIFSDDMDYCRHHFECMGNIVYVEGSDIEQLCAMTLCSDFVISNSTFSYCGAYLAQRGKVVRPVKNMDGPLAAKNDEKDYWPDSWIIHENEKLQLTDTTFTIPVYNDHKDRRENVALNVCMLQRDFDTNIIIGEQLRQDFSSYEQYGVKYMHFDIPVFHRTKMLNDMAIEAQTPIVYNWDADVFMAPLQIWLAVNMIRQGSDFVYPYDGRFARVPRMPWFKKLEQSLDTWILHNQGFKGKGGKDVISSVGGAVAFSKDAFIDSGMENENMISYAPEDCERWDRWHMLGYKVERVKGCLYHIDHYVGPNSSARNPLFDANHKELDKIRAMNTAGLRAYVDSWQWVNRYSESYYSRIAPGAVESAKTVYDAIGFTKGSVIDIGCGLGEWNNGNPEYIGVDYRVMKRSLMFPMERYYDYDLTGSEPFPISRRFDLCLCLEVLEHIPEEFADRSVALLCSLSDTVLFSAAIPGQGGESHINEQWQSWWAEKFEDNGFYPHTVQPKIRDNKNVEVWYRNNILLYTNFIDKYDTHPVEDFVHPDLFLNIAKLAGTLK